jgi:hypothetical protein
MAIPRRHHYLPQFYLQGFTKPPNGKKQGLLRVVDFFSGNCFFSSPKDVANIRDYYTIESPDGEPDPIIETQVFGQIDGQAATIIREIVSRRALPMGGEWAALCRFVASLDTRIPRFRQMTYQIAQVYDDLQLLAKGGLTKDDVQRIQQEGGKEAEVDQVEHIAMMLDQIRQISEVAMQMTPHLLFAPIDTPFITSDSPIFKFDKDEKRRVAQLESVGWITKEVEVTVPLSKGCCLVLDWTGRPRFMDGDRFMVANCNRLRAYASYQYLFAESPDFVFLGSNSDILVGEKEVLHSFAASKQGQAVEIVGGPLPPRPPKKHRR